MLLSDSRPNWNSSYVVLSLVLSLLSLALASVASVLALVARVFALVLALVPLLLALACIGSCNGFIGSSRHPYGNGHAKDNPHAYGHAQVQVVMQHMVLYNTHAMPVHITKLR